MNPEAQRIAIAEACGWKKIKKEPVPGYSHPKTGEGLYTIIGQQWNGSHWNWFAIPDYLNDLNAMHEAEKVLLEKELQSTYYLQELPKVCHQPLAHATAAQRAEAFLKCLGKWQENKPVSVTN